MNRFYINETLVDIDRCRLNRNGESIALEPKVMQVLQFLSMHQGEVVSHQSLLAAIWPNTVVEPGALQRCIAQLRKAFQDGARQQRIIATYPKRGYSLVAEVRPEAITPVEPVNIHQAKPLHRYLWPALAASLAAFFIWLPESNPGIASTERTPSAIFRNVPVPEISLPTNPALLAATNNPDDFPVYSPDGRFVVYPRYLDKNLAHLWARDLAYGKDFLLTEEAGIYEHLAWSQDSSQMLFVDASCQSGQCSIPSCYSLKSVAISQSETNAPSVEQLIDCSPSRLLSPQWLNNRKLVVIEVDTDRASLVQYNLKNQERLVLYQSADPIPYRLSFSHQTGTLTIMGITPAGRKELLFLDINSGTINRNDTAVFIPEEDWYPSSTPL